MTPFAQPLTDLCCLCGANEGLSGEHKIKASALRAEFGKKGMIIGRQGESYRHAQGPNSKAFHFAARVCVDCNSARTQRADLAFDAFNAEAQMLSQRGIHSSKVFDDPRFRQPDGSLYLDVFRYFAKLMCCHLAEMGAPFFRAIADFAIGTTHDNFVLLAVDRDVAYRRLKDALSSTHYAAHGGLVLMGHEVTHAPTSFYSTLTIGPVRYRYQIQLNDTGQLLLRLENHEFYAWCERHVRASLESPMSDDDRDLLGLSRSPPG